METLKKNYEFSYIFTKGKCGRSKNIDIFYCKNHTNINKIGIAVSKKIGNSVKRNKIRRLLRENYRLLEENIGKGYSMIIVWKKNRTFENANFYTIKEEMLNIFKNEKIINKID